MRLRYVFLDKDAIIGDVEALDDSSPLEVYIQARAEGSEQVRISNGVVHRAGSEEVF